MELLSSSIASTAAAAAQQSRLLRPPSSCRPGTRPAWFVSCRSNAVRSKLTMKAVPPIHASFQPAFPQHSIFQDANRKRRNAPCYQRQKAPQIEAKSMEEVYDALAEHLLSVLKNIEDPDSKYIVGLAGPPGAGKSTVASEVVRRVNMLWSQKHTKGSEALLPTEEIAAMLPMDGFHLYRAQLDAMEDPKEAHARRGAPWTFNPSLFLKCLQTLRTEGSVYAPSFDHGVGDPVENDIFVKPQHKIVIVEGNYLLLEEDAWREIRDLFDEKWFIDIDIDVSMQRVLRRHIATGKEPDVAAWRISYNDRPNAELIMESRKNADLVIRSVDFSG
ncbi:putative uridine kinase [Dichanthelium oligosanthes]|uniref:Putative uridine kinase n=1 Tax=Dichanthelium oligosanthes TaxID=888268 RepID=A0A1E5W1G1_9POAL|nr:putative uridine kinase [Dichanthelium oligosanthes]